PLKQSIVLEEVRCPFRNLFCSAKSLYVRQLHGCLNSPYIITIDQVLFPVSIACGYRDGCVCFYNIVLRSHSMDTAETETEMLDEGSCTVLKNAIYLIHFVRTCTLFVPPSSTTALSIFDPENSYEPPQHLNYNAFMNPPPPFAKKKKAFLQQNILRRPYFYHFFQMKKPSLVKSIAKRAITSPVFYFKQPPFPFPFTSRGGYEYQGGGKSRDW
ncbi:hypothetical protein CEXT_50601, partial [Caerostris extrusa]